MNSEEEKIENNSEIKEENNETIEFENSDLFDENAPFEDSEVKEKKKFKLSDFLKNHKKIVIIVISSIIAVLIAVGIFFAVRISSATKACKQIAGDDYYSRQYITDALKALGYNDSEIEKAIKNNKIDFEVNIKESLYAQTKSPTTLLSKKQLISELTKRGYTDEEIEHLFLVLNWQEFLENYLANYIAASTDNINKRNFLNELRSNGFIQDDINIISSSAKWIELGKSYVEKYFNENTSAGKGDVKTYLESFGFSINEVETIFDSIDWNKQALVCINNYINKSDEKEEKDDKDDKDKKKETKEIEITKALFDKVLKEKGFSEEEIQYAIDNFDFSAAIEKIVADSVKSDEKLIKKKEIEASLKKKKFTQEEIDAAFEKINWNDYAYATLSQYLTTNGANKKGALKYLSDNGYSEEEVEYAEEKITWSNFAAKALAYMLEGNKKTKDQLFDTLEDYGYSEDDILTAKASITFSKYAYNYIMNTQSSSTLSIISQKELQNLLSKAGYEDEFNSIIGKFDFEKNAKNYLKSLMDSYLSDPKEYDISKIYETMQNKGYTNAVASYINSYDWGAFANSWSSKFIEKSNNEPNKKTYDESFDRMKIDVNASVSLKTKLTATVDWEGYAKNIAENHKNEGKDSVINKLNDMGYSDYINTAIEGIDFPSEEQPTQ